jgi:hypothetical protein
MRLVGLVWRSALLNVAIVLTALPVLAYAGGPDALVPALGVITLVSAVLWVTTFAVFFLVWIIRLVWRQGVRGLEHLHRGSERKGGLADEWLDGQG